MKIIRTALLLTVFLSICAGLFAGGFALSGIGSRAISMAGAFRGLADDPSAMYWNPAGMSFIDFNELVVGGSAIQPNARWTNTAPLPGFKVNEELAAENKLSLFPSLLAVYADNPRTKFGLGVYVPYGLGSTYDAFELPSTMPGIPAGATLEWSPGFPKDEMSSSIAIVDVHPSMSYRLLDNFSLGFGFSLLYGSIDLAQVKPHATNSYYVPTTFEMSGTGWGFGGNIGAIFKPIDQLSLGLTYKMPSKLPLEGDAEIKTWLSNYVYASLPGGSLQPVTSGGESDIEAELNLPGEAGIGLSYKVLPNWCVNLDFAYSMWSALEEIEVTLKDPVTVLGNAVPDPVLVFNWIDSSRINLGTEYRFGANALRGGVYYDQSPIEEEVQIPTLSDIGAKISGNIGYGRDFGPFTLDVNGQYIMFSERDVETKTANNMVGNYKSDVIAANLGLTYRF